MLENSNVFGIGGRGPYLAHLGQIDQALVALEEAYETQNPYLPCVNTEPRCKGSRSHPRFQDLLRRMNFPE